MSTRIYANHRETQREWILQVAEDLFTDKGIEKVTIADIAEAARLTRATLYKYFTSKEHMAQEIFRLVTRCWFERDECDVWSIPGTGFERVERFVRTDMSVDLLLAVVFNFNSSLLSRLGEFGSKVEGEYGINVQSIFAQICRVFLDGLKAQPYHRASSGMPAQDS
ncbi:MAG: TetR/AcrR family transcriptional regulator [Anaerolineae bacterium]|nr:TetR/AcrR family transcriptional regulator [Anaerolineae bacterium]